MCCSGDTLSNNPKLAFFRPFKQKLCFFLWLLPIYSCVEHDEKLATYFCSIWYARASKNLAFGKNLALFLAYENIYVCHTEIEICCQFFHANFFLISMPLIFSRKNIIVTIPTRWCMMYLWEVKKEEFHSQSVKKTYVFHRRLFYSNIYCGLHKN